ncbi:MAG: PilZ domain-containing protein [Bdellovibrionota bacterium]
MIDEKRGGKVVDHLAAPRKKKRDFLAFAVSENFDRSLALSIDAYIGMNFPGLTLVHPEGMRDVQRLVNREIVLLLLEDKFVGVEQTISLVKALKVKKSERSLPVLFLTDDPGRLISLYHEHLMAFQEVDSYIAYRNATEEQIFAKIRHGINHQNSRRSRRYKINVGITYHHLTKDREFPGTLLDMSVHGAILKCKEKDVTFRDGDQLRINLPLNEKARVEMGDFVKISAKVRRVFIGGSEAAISWEHLSENQLYYITEFITESVRLNMTQNIRIDKMKAMKKVRV